jgi:hypothetical protein
VIDGAKQRTYTLTREDGGHTVRLLVWAWNEMGASFAQSRPTDQLVLTPPVNLQPPRVSGTMRVGQALQGNVGQWSSVASGLRFTFAWQRCDAHGEDCHLIDGQEDKGRYTLTREDGGHTIRFFVYAHNVEDSAWQRSSPTDELVLAPPVNLQPPRVSGTMRVGQALQGYVGQWDSVAPGLRFTFVWQRCDAQGEDCHLIDGQDKSRYTLTGEDGGHTIRLLIWAFNREGQTFVQSQPTAVVTGA